MYCCHWNKQIKKKKKSTCAVAVCKNTSRNCRSKFHGFSRAFEIRAQRIKKCYRNDALNPNPTTARICQVHFLKEHYYEGLPKKLKLKWDVIPNQNLKPADKEGKKNNMSRNERMRKRQKNWKCRSSLAKTLLTECRMYAVKCTHMHTFHFECC